VEASSEVMPPRVLGTKGEAGSLSLELGDEAEEEALLKGAAEVEVADDGIVLLAVAIDSAVALLEAVGVVGELDVKEVVAAIVEVEALGGWRRC
jgi:hypothetical protein